MHGYLQEIEASSGLRFEVTDAVRAQIYANSVFPTQGTRPVFSSVHGLMSAPLVDFTLWAPMATQIPPPMATSNSPT